MSEEKCRLCTKLKSDHFELSNGYASWKYCDDPTDKDLWYKNACRKFEQSQEPVPTAMTVIGEINTDDYATGGCGCGCVPRDIILRVKGLDEPYRTMLLSSAEKDARIKELEDKLKNADIEILSEGNGSKIKSLLYKLKNTFIKRF